MPYDGQLHDLILYSWERAHRSQWRGGWVGPRVGLDVVAKRKNPCPCKESNPGFPSQSLITILTQLSQRNYFSS